MLNRKYFLILITVFAFEASFIKHAYASLYACIEEESIAMDESENWRMFRVHLDRFTIKMDFEKPSIESEKIKIMPFNSVCLSSTASTEFTCSTG